MTGGTSPIVEMSVIYGQPALRHLSNRNENPPEFNVPFALQPSNYGASEGPAVILQKSALDRLAEI